MKKLNAVEVKEIMRKESEDSPWATQTLRFVLSTIDECEEKLNPTWWMEDLAAQELEKIFLPEHRHEISDEPTEPISFPDDTPVSEAIRRLMETPEVYSVKCKDHIESLSEAILQDGFTSTLMLEQKAEGLYHLDGLHRLLALQLAIERGLKLESVPCIFFKADEKPSV